MRAPTEGPGVPDFGPGLKRERLGDLIAGHGNRPTLLVGPSGTGKSFAAAQCSRACQGATIWVDAGGTFLAPAQLADMVAKASGASGWPGFGLDSSAVDLAAQVVGLLRRPDASEALLVVVDDLGTPTAGADFGCIEAIGATLWRLGSRLLVTTRTIENWPPETLCRWGILDAADLALTVDEAEELAEMTGLHPRAGNPRQLHEACSGHVAFFRTLLVQASRHGLEVTSLRAASLDAWLVRAIEESIGSGERSTLQVASLLRRGGEADLAEMGIRSPVAHLKTIASVLPLVTLGSDDQLRLTFRVHDLIDGYFVERHDGSDPELLETAIGVLTRREEYPRACELLVRLGESVAAVAWLQQYGERALAASCYAELDRLLRSIPVSQLMGSAALLVLWSQACSGLGRYDEALAKARAARPIAEHERDSASVAVAVSQSLQCLREMGRHDEAVTLAEEVVASKEDLVDQGLLAQALLCVGVVRAYRGDLEEAEVPLRAAARLASRPGGQRHVRRYAEHALGVIPILRTGNLSEAGRVLATMLDDPDDTPATRVTVKSNLAWLMVDSGRLERADALARSALREADDYGLSTLSSNLLGVTAVARYGMGESTLGIAELRRSIDLSAANHGGGDASANRTYLAQCLRAEGQVEESLVEAETALEGLSAKDNLGFFRRFASLEVAASLLRGGDLASARTWVQSSGALEPPASPNHGVRAAMILAECDRREIGVEAAIGHLRTYAHYVEAENANWQGALYCRAFPSLAGVLALAVGVGNLPVHMLRMIPPESAEVILADTRSWLEDGVWQALGRRLLGEDEFEKYLARDGLPVCHVHFFGGLEVSIGGRSIREKDWRKRKARLLFAMLVLKRGHDVPREQLFEHLFPDMDLERAKNNLYVVWSTMKSVLQGEDSKGAPFPYFEAIGGVCRSVRENIRSDVDDFDKLLASGSKHEAAGERGAALRDYERLSSLYRGDLLPGDVYDDWFAELREHYRVSFVNAMLAAGAILMDADDPGNALVYVRRAIQTDPLREDLYQVALRCQIAGGQRSGAIDTYLQCRSRLSEDLGLDPSVETRALYDQILAMEDKPRVIPLDPIVD